MSFSRSTISGMALVALAKFFLDSFTYFSLLLGSLPLRRLGGLLGSSGGLNPKKEVNGTSIQRER